MLQPYALAFLLLLVTGAAAAQQRCTPIQFARGASSASIRGMASSEEPFTCFTLAAERGQTAAIKLTQSNGDTAFNIGGVIDNRDNYSFKTDARNYQIDVYQMSSNRRPAPFTMQVSVQ